MAETQSIDVENGGQNNESAGKDHHMLHGAVRDGEGPLSVLKQQLRVVHYFFSDTRMAVPMWIIWVASFGGSLHAPVTTFFLLELDLTEIQIGQVGFFISAGSILLAPLYGYFLDSGMIHVPHTFPFCPIASGNCNTTDS